MKKDIVRVTITLHSNVVDGNVTFSNSFRHESLDGFEPRDKYQSETYSKASFDSRLSEAVAYVRPTYDATASESVAYYASQLSGDTVRFGTNKTLNLNADSAAAIVAELRRRFPSVI